MERYNKITNKNPREIVLLKGRPCAWGKCCFCDYIEDNSRDVQEMNALNQEVLSHVTGELGVLEVINSGSCFELPEETLKMIKEIIAEKQIHRLFLNPTGCTGNICRKCGIIWEFPLLLKLVWKHLIKPSGRSI